MLAGRQGHIANGNISPCRFVKLDTTAGQAFDGRVIAVTGTTDLCVGISQEGTRNVPYGALNDGFAAAAGEPILVFGFGDQCLLELGTGGITRGARIATDATGKGILAGAAVNGYARAEQTGIAGDKVLVTIIVDTPGTT